jgi:hypothetical protein
VFGPPSPAVIEMLRAQAGAGVRMVSFSEHLGGFTRRSWPVSSSD